MKTGGAVNKVGIRADRAIQILVVLLLLLGESPGLAQDTRIECEICHNLKNSTSVVSMTDEVRQTKRIVCSTCFKSDHSCELCKLPVLPTARWDLGDGRFLCHQDSKVAMVDPTESKNLFEHTQREIQSMLAHWPPLPDRGIEFHLVNRADFVRQQRVLPMEGRYENKLGLTVSSKPEGDAWSHQIYILSGLPRERFQAVAMHELTHVWLHEHQSKTRVLHRDTEEGFCELIAHRYMTQLGWTNEVKTILANTYTRGQIAALLSAESQYQFFRVIDWILGGVDSYIETTNAHRLLVLREKSTSNPSAGPELVSQQQSQVLGLVSAERVSKEFKHLEVTSISGIGRKPLAMINHMTVEIGEKARIRIQGTNWTLRCLEIQKDHVMVQIEETQEKRRLDLKP